MAKINRHHYKKINNEWKVFKTTTLHFDKIPYNKETILEYIEKIKTILTPKFLSKKYKKENEKNSLYGHCYHTTQAMYFLLNTDTLEAFTAIDYRGDQHWWLKDKNDNSIIDVTADQYYLVNKQPPYDKGKAKSWYGWKGRPHIRTFKLIMKLQPESKLSRLTNN